MSKRNVLLSLALSLVMALSFALVGCGGGGTSTSPASTGTASTGAADDGVKTVAAGLLTVGSDCDYPPFIEMDGAQPKGYEYELLEAIAAEIGVELSYLPPQNFDTILASIASNSKMDIGVSSFTINDDRLKLVDFSLPYFDSNQAAVALIDSDFANAMDFNGKTLGAQSGTTGADWVKENLTDSGTILKEYNAASEMMAALATGDIVGAFFDEPAAAEYVATTYTNAHIIESIPTGEQYGMAISKDNPGLLEAVNNAMKTIKQNGTFDTIFLKYFPELTPPSIG